MIAQLLDTSQFMSRFSCIHSSFKLAMLYAIPNFGTALIYSLGFVSIYIMLKKKTKIMNLKILPMILTLYGFFFFFCGGTHALDACALWWPAYNFFVVWEWCQFIIALFAFFYTYQFVRNL